MKTMYKREYEIIREKIEDTQARNAFDGLWDENIELRKRVTELKRDIVVKDTDDFLDFGCANGWSINDARDRIIELCKKRGHKRSLKDVGPPNRGLENVVRCDSCKYRYWYDSSD